MRSGAVPTGVSVNVVVVLNEIDYNGRARGRADTRVFARDVNDP